MPWSTKKPPSMQVAKSSPDEVVFFDKLPREKRSGPSATEIAAFAGLTKAAFDELKLRNPGRVKELREGCIAAADAATNAAQAEAKALEAEKHRANLKAKADARKVLELEQQQAAEVTHRRLSIERVLPAPFRSFRSVPTLMFMADGTVETPEASGKTDPFSADRKCRVQQRIVSIQPADHGCGHLRSSPPCR